MIYSELKNSTLISKLCFGCEPLGGIDWGKVEVKEIEKAIEISLELGLNFFDTADVYGLGLSEERLSKILGNRRHDLVISTKGGVSWSSNKNSRASIAINCSPDYLAKAVENSLRRLSLEYIPIYYVHWPDPKVEIKKTFEMLSNLQHKGKIGLIGCSNFSRDQLVDATNHADIAIVQAPLNPLDKPLPDYLSALCNKYHIQIVAYNVLGFGLLTGKFKKSQVFPEEDRRSRVDNFKTENFDDVSTKIKEIEDKARLLNMSLLEYTLDWVLKIEHVVSAITGIKTSPQVVENINSLQKI